MEPSTTSTNTLLIGQEDHDGDSDWDRLSAKYCDFIVGHIERNCGGWGDLGIEAFEDAVERIRKKGGLFIKDYEKGMFRKALIRLSRDMLSVMGRRRDRRCEREREVAEGMRVLRQPSRPSGLSSSSRGDRIPQPVWRSPFGNTARMELRRLRSPTDRSMRSR